MPRKFSTRRFYAQLRTKISGEKAIILENFHALQSFSEAMQCANIAMFGKSFFHATIRDYAAPAAIAVRDKSMKKWLAAIKEANPVSDL